MLITLILFILISSITGTLFYLYLHFKAKASLEQRIDQMLNHTNNRINSQSKYKNSKIAFFEKLKLLERKLTETIFGFTRETSARFRLRFEQAGFPSQNAPVITLLINAAMVFMAIVGYLYAALHFKALREQMFILQILFLVLTIFIAYRIFEYCMDYIIYRRYKRIHNSLAFCVDLLAICTKASFTLDRSFEKIAEEVALFNKDIFKEFAHVGIELSIIPNRVEALRNLANRVETPTMHLLVSGLIHAEEQGVSLSQTLITLSQEITKQKILDVEAKAARLPVLLTIPLAFLCLPAMMLIIMGPVIANITRSTFFN